MQVLDPLVLLHPLAITPHEPLCGQEALHSHGTPRMDPACRNTHLCTQAKPEPVCKPRRCIVEDARTVNGLEEAVSCGLVVCHNAVSVAASVPVKFKRWRIIRPSGSSAEKWIETYA